MLAYIDEVTGLPYYGLLSYTHASYTDVYAWLWLPAYNTYLHAVCNLSGAFISLTSCIICVCLCLCICQANEFIPWKGGKIDNRTDKQMIILFIAAAQLISNLGRAPRLFAAWTICLSYTADTSNHVACF